MAVSGVRRATFLLVPVALAGLAGCTGASGTGSSATTAKSTVSTGPGTPSASGTSAARDLISAAKLKNALLTRVNGVVSAGPASTGAYDAIAPSGAGKRRASGVVVTPKVCAGGVQTGFNAAPLSGHPAASVTFKVGKDGVSEVLVSSSTASASTALAAHVPAACARYHETIDGKTFTYGVQETAVSGIGDQAKALSVQTSRSSTERLWSLIYRGKGFVGTVTVVGPNASEKAVRELGAQAYALAAKTLS